jgi:hypothetical protein
MVRIWAIWRRLKLRVSLSLTLRFSSFLVLNQSADFFKQIRDGICFRIWDPLLAEGRATQWPL